MNSQMRNDFQNSGAGSVHRPPIDWDDPSNAEERQIWQAATLFERERCALVCEQNQVARIIGGRTKLCKFDPESKGTHEGMTYATAIRQGGEA